MKKQHDKVTLGYVLRKSHEDGTYEDVGCIVWVERKSNTFWWIPLPEVVVVDEKAQRCRRKHYIKAVRRGAISLAEADEAWERSSLDSLATSLECASSGNGAFDIAGKDSMAPSVLVAVMTAIQQIS